MLILRKEFDGYEDRQKVENLPESDVPNIFDAAAYGDVEELEEALKHWDVNAQDRDEMTALHHAAISLKFENVDRLLEEIENGLDPTIVDRFDRDAAWATLEVHGHKDPVARKMYDKLSPYVYPVAEEDLAFYADDAPEA